MMTAKPGILLMLIGVFVGVACAFSSVEPSPPSGNWSWLPEVEQPEFHKGSGVTILGSMERPGLPNLYRHDVHIFSGGLPRDAAAFLELKQLGVRTVISVDGAEPDVAAATAAGIRYVHLPIGYDGISRVRRVELLVAVRDLPGSVYIHCHRGLHRGPAAAVAVRCMNGSFEDPHEVEVLLKELGTAPKYSGLYRDAADATPLTPEEAHAVTAAGLPARAAVPPLTHQMVELEHAWERWGKEGSKTEQWNPALQAEAVNLAEILLEAGRLLEETADRAALRNTLLDDGRWFADSVERAVDSPAGLSKLMKMRCDDCHARFRDH